MTDRKCLSCTVPFAGLCGSLKTQTTEKLAKLANRRYLETGQNILNEKQQNKSCFIIISGIAKIIASYADGQDQIVGLKFPAEFVGYPFKNTRHIYAQAATAMEIYSFSGSAFESFMEKHQDLEHAILKCALDELEAAQNWMHMISRKTAEERVASLLLFIIKKMYANNLYLKSRNTYIEIEMPINRTEVSECLGLRLETVSRQIAEFKSDGIITTGPHRRINILKLGELENRAHVSM